MGRGTCKDFVDLHALAQRHKPLPELIDLYRRKYSTGDMGHLLVALAYFDDADREPMPRMVQGTAWEDVKRDVKGWVREMAGRGA